MAGEVVPNENIDNEMAMMEEPLEQSQTEGPLGPLMNAWNNPQQRLYIIIAGAVLVVLLAVFMMNGGGSKELNENRGKLVPLVQELDQARAFEIVAKLKSVNIEAKVQPSEKPGEYVCYVYENAIETSYLALSRTNLLVDEGYGLFDSNDWAASDYDKRVKLTRAINGDLSKIISRMKGLRAAVVRVNLPEQQLFTELQSPTTATVQVELQNDGEELTKTQVKSIVNVLRGYVPNLEAEHVSIVDTAGHNYSTFKEEDEADSDDFIDQVEKINSTIEKRIKKYLDAVIGTGNYQVSASAAVSREKVQKQATTYTEGAVGSRQTGKEKLKAGAPSKVGPGAVNGKNYNHDSSSETFLPSFEQEQVTYLPGRIMNVSVALAVDKAVPVKISLQQLQDSVAAIAGPNIKSDNIKITVVDMHASDSVTPVAPKRSGFMSGVFKGGIWSGLTKILGVVAIVIGLLITAIIALNFLNGSANDAEYQTEYDEELGDEFDQVINDYDPNAPEPSDYGEDAVLEQQEALLREMMGVQEAQEAQAEKAAAVSYSSADDQNVEFESLLNNFQSVANNKPDLLAKKIQTWLEDE